MPRLYRNVTEPPKRSREGEFVISISIYDKAPCPQCGQTSHFGRGCPKRKRESGKKKPNAIESKNNSNAIISTKVCRYPGCEGPPLLAGRCLVHFPGYKPLWSPYKTNWWAKTRKQFIADHPVCNDPFGRHSVPVQAAHVDHIKRHRLDLKLFIDKSNLQSLCVDCHNIKTGLEDSFFGARRKEQILRIEMQDDILNPVTIQQRQETRY